MRLLITSDLHYRPAQRDRYLAFAEWVQAQEPDCFVIAGDTGHPLRLFERGLQLFAGLSCPRLLIAGNHDVYRNTHSSRELFQEYLPRSSRDQGFVWLEAQSVVLGSTAICGTMGWYDYSSHAVHLPYAGDEYRRIKGLVNHDADYVDWPWSDRAMARFLAKGFRSRLDALQVAPQVRRIVAVTHWPIFAASLPEHPESTVYSLMRAYAGNFTLGRLVVRYSKVSHAISGHLHRGGRWTIETPHGPLDCRVVGSRPGEPGCVQLVLPD